MQLSRSYIEGHTEALGWVVAECLSPASRIDNLLAVVWTPEGITRRATDVTQENVNAWDGLVAEVATLSHLRSVLFAAAVVVNDLSVEAYGAGAWPVDRSAYPDPSWGGLTRQSFEQRVDEITARVTQAYDALSESSLGTKLADEYAVNFEFAVYVKRRSVEARKRIGEARDGVAAAIEMHRVVR